MATALEMEVLNHYPCFGSAPPLIFPTGVPNDCSLRPYRSGGLPVWQTDIIDHFPLLYRSEESVGLPDYCHLVFGFQVDEKWARLLGQMSEYGTRLIHELRNSASQPDARTAVIRVCEKQGRLHIQANDNLQAPHREIWHAFLQACSDSAPHTVLPRFSI